jgi:hypothetical protein
MILQVQHHRLIELIGKYQNNKALYTTEMAVRFSKIDFSNNKVNAFAVKQRKTTVQAKSSRMTLYLADN